MSEGLTIKSIFKEYRMDFVEDFTAPLRNEAANGAYFIVDQKVSSLYKERLENNLPKDRTILIEANEHNKTIDNCKDVIEVLIKKNVRRNHKLIAIGGGITQDITAFIASILYRGINWSFIPTTLLAQADSCIGSKTSINLGDKKNLIGNFCPPSNIYIDTIFLESLAVDDIKSGIGEILHFYFFSNSPLLDKLIANYQEMLTKRTLLLEHIKESLSIKKTLIEIDEFDKGERNKFNYGHTFGHAIESFTDYKISHGQAVTIGMDIANHISSSMGLMDKETFEKLHSILSVNFPDYKWEQCDMENYFSALSRDKKNIGDNLGCILSGGPGFLAKKQISLDAKLKDTITFYFSNILPGLHNPL